MPEPINPPPTLRAALIAEGPPSADQLALLNEEAGSLTRERFIRIVNSDSFDGLPNSTLIILRKISILRLKGGQPVFPWHDRPFLDAMLFELPPGMY